MIRRPAYPTWPLHREKEMEDVQNEHLRNIAINAHIDHGKTGRRKRDCSMDYL